MWTEWRSLSAMERLGYVDPGHSRMDAAWRSALPRFPSSVTSKMSGPGCGGTLAQRARDLPRNQQFLTLTGPRLLF